MTLSGAPVTSALADNCLRHRASIASASAMANAVKAKTGQKGKALFHPIRIVLTGKADGPELDLMVPAIDRGADLPLSAGIPSILGCRERAAAFARALEKL